MKPGGTHFEVSGGTKPASLNEIEQVRQSLQNENTAAIESRKYPKNESPLEFNRSAKDSASPIERNSPLPIDNRAAAASKSRRAKKFASLDIADEGFAFGPKEARLKQIRASNVLEMRTDTFSNFNLMPTSKYDTYQRQLRGMQSNRAAS